MPCAIELSLKGLNHDETLTTLRITQNKLLSDRLIPQFSRLGPLSLLKITILWNLKDIDVGVGICVLSHLNGFLVEACLIGCL